MVSEAQGTTANSANKGVKRGLPVVGLLNAEDAAGKLWGVARLGTTSLEAFARQFGDRAKASGSTWDTRIALLRGFKLIDTKEGQVGLSDLGQQIVNGSSPQAQLAARRAAMLNLRAYRDLVQSFDGTPLPEMSTLATRLQFEYGKSEEVAGRAAQAFKDSLEHAQMLDSNGLVRRDGAASASTDLPPTPTPSSTDAEDDAEAVEIDAAFGEDDDDDDNVVNANDLTQNQTPQGAADIDVESILSTSLNVSLDLSRYDADDVIRILRELKGGVVRE